jgi:hypothetical protein
MPPILDEQTGYQATLLEMERDLHGPARTVFPIDVELGNKTHRFAIWDGQQLPDQLLAYDTETSLIRDFPFGITWNHSRLGMLPIVTTCAPPRV